jgi:anti-sigma regulatory factor (Ser/Thr protein kinase)
VLTDSATESLRGKPAGFQHDAFVYTDDEEFLRHTASFVRDALRAGDFVLVALPPSRLDLLRDELGSWADQVDFVDMTEAGSNPARIIPLWQRVLDQHPGRGITGIGEPAYVGRTAVELEEAKLHEALLNLAFEHSGPFQLRCPYDASLVSTSLDPAENHPTMADTAARGFSPAVAEDMFRTPLPGVPADAEQRVFELGDLTELRHWVNARARSRGLSTDRVSDLALALHEICTNSVRFGGGGGILSLWIDDGSLVCDVTDEGSIDDLLVGRVLPPVSGLGGRGVWLANQLCDLVQIRSGKTGTQIRLHTRLR